MASQASTYTPNNALAYAKLFVKNSPIDNATIAPQLLDTAYRFLWMLAPWSWTLGALSIVTFSSGVQDYTATDPEDFLRLEWAGRSRANDRMEDLSIVAALPSDTAYKQPPVKISVVSISGGNINLRFWPTPNNSSERVFSLYKKVSTKIVAGNQASAVLVFPDEFFPLYQEIVLMKAYQYLQDQRAGSAQVDGRGQFAYTGQLAIVMAMVEQYKKAEPILLNTMGFETRSEGSRV